MMNAETTNKETAKMIIAQNIASKFWLDTDGNARTFQSGRVYGVVMQVIPGVIDLALVSNRRPDTVASWGTKRTAEEIARNAEGLVESGAYRWESVYNSKETAADSVK
jgi:hypothetical protein